MAFRLYIVPAEGDPFSEQGRHPKYIFGLGSYGAIDYGFQPTYLVAADLTVAQDASVTANADVFAFPTDLSGNVGGGNVQNARNAFEAALIPGQWIAAQSTWLEIARTVAAMFRYMTNLYTILGNTVVIDSSTKLNIQWSTIPPDIQTAMDQAAASLGYTFNPQPNDQLRAILKTLADQWGNKPFNLNGFIF